MLNSINKLTSKINLGNIKSISKNNIVFIGILIFSSSIMTVFYFAYKKFVNLKASKKLEEEAKDQLPKIAGNIKELIALTSSSENNIAILDSDLQKINEDISKIGDSISNVSASVIRAKRIIGRRVKFKPNLGDSTLLRMADIFNYFKVALSDTSVRLKEIDQKLNNPIDLSASDGLNFDLLDAMQLCSDASVYLQLLEQKLSDDENDTYWNELNDLKKKGFELEEKLEKCKKDAMNKEMIQVKESFQKLKDSFIDHSPRILEIKCSAEKIHSQIEEAYNKIRKIERQLDGFKISSMQEEVSKLGYKVTDVFNRIEKIKKQSDKIKALSLKYKNNIEESKSNLSIIEESIVA